MTSASSDRKLIACDCDLVVAPTDRLHWAWLCAETGQNVPFPEGKILPYNLGECFGIPERAMDFWRREDLYDCILPISGSVEALKKLSEVVDIVFVSAIKGYHTKSKYYFLRAHFPFMKGYVATKEKHLIRCDAIIDDRLENLAKMPEGVITIQYETPYMQYVDFTPDLKFSDWGSVVRRLNG